VSPIHDQGDQHDLTKIAALVAGLALVAFAASGTALASGGNSANAKRCQKNGWQSLVTSGGTSFASEEACTSYAAMGGVLFASSSAPCLNNGWQDPAQRSDGTAFGSEADCLAYTSANGVVYKPSLIADPSHAGEEQNIAVIASGFHPNSSGGLKIVSLPTMASITLFAVTNAYGGFTASSVFTAGACAGGTTGAQYEYVDVFGVHASASATLDCP
jgi:hypothetical protein